MSGWRPREVWREGEGRARCAEKAVGQPKKQDLDKNKNNDNKKIIGFPGGSGIKNLPANAGDIGDVNMISGLGRSPGGENGNPLQCSCLENPKERGAWRATVHWVAESQT